MSQAAPLIIPVPSGASERYSSHLERISETQAAPIVIPVPSGGSERYTRLELFNETINVKHNVKMYKFKQSFGACIGNESCSSANRLSNRWI